MKKQYIRSLKNATRLSALAFAATATSLSAIERVKPAAEPKEKGSLATKKTPRAQNAGRPLLGVFGQPVNEAVAEHLGIKGGVTLSVVSPGSAASKAGFKVKDIITKIDNKQISQQHDIKNALASKRPGEKVRIEIISKGKKSTLQVKLGKAPDLAQNYPQQKPNIKPKALPERRRGTLPPEILRNLPQEQRERIEEMLKNFDPELGNQKRLQFDKLLQSQMSMNLLDSEGSIKLKGKNGKREIELYDLDGKLLYKGPYNNAKDQAKIPKALKSRVNRIDLFLKQQNKKNDI